VPLKLADLLTKTPPDPEWLIEKMIHKHQFVVAAGDAGVGKSFFWYTAAFGIVLGSHFLLNRQCAQGPVLYFDDENSLPDLRDYLLKIWWAYGCPDPELIGANLIIEHFMLSKAGDAWPGYMSACISKVQPCLVVVDTVTTALSVEDENDNAEASRIVRSLRRCMAQGRPDASLLAMKHAKDGRVRGAKAWEGMPDQVLVQSRLVGKQRADGYHNSKIESTKRRTFGLREALKIIPVNGGSAISLKSEPLQVKQKKGTSKRVIGT